MKRAITTLLLLLLLPTAAGLWVVGSSSGLKWLLTQVAPANSLQIESIDGSLITGVRINNIHYQDEKLTLSLEELLLNWRTTSLWNLELNAEMLYLRRLRIELGPSDDTPLVLPNIRLPVTLQLDDMQVNDLEIIKSGATLIKINNASLRAHANRAGVIIKYLDISGDTAQITLQGTLHPYEHYWHNLQLQWQLESAALPTLNGGGTLKGDLRQTTLQHKLTHPLTATTELTLFEPLQNLHWQASLQLPQQQLNATHKNWPAQKLALSLRGRGDMKQATVDGFTVSALNSSITGSGALDWQMGLNWQAAIQSPGFDLGALWALLQVPGPAFIVGVDARLNGDLNHLTARDITLQALDGTITGSADVQWQAPLQWQTTFAARDFALDQLWPLIALDHYGLPAGRANLASQLSGDTKGMTFNITSLQAQGASLTGNGKVSWHDKIEWQTSLDGEAIDPARWQPQRLTDWPGRLATHFESRGHYANNAVQSSFLFEGMNGVLRGYPFQLQTQLQLAQEQLTIESLDLSSAESHISANGTLGQEISLKWRLDSPQLAQLYPETSGRLSIDGQLHGEQSAPLLKLRLNGSNIAYAGDLIGELDGQAELQLFNWQQILLNVRARDLQLAGTKIDSVAIDAKGEATDHQLRLGLQMADIKSDWLINGSFDQAAELWLGQIDHADINHSQLGMWQLRSTTPLIINREHSSLSPLCWQQQPSLLCLSGLQQQDEWRATLSGEAINLTLLTPWLPRDLQVEGETRLNAAIQYRPAEPLVASAAIHFNNGNVSYPIVEGERSEWHFEGGKLEAALDEQGLRSQLHLALADKDEISATLDLKHYNPLTTVIAEQPIKGEINAAFSDLGLINNLLYEVQGLNGRIEMNSRISGTVSQPAIVGQVTLRDGSFKVPRLGLSLSELSFDASSRGKEKVNYQLQMKSGDGTIKAVGETRLDAREGWPTTIKLTGEMFELSHIPEARIVISPDLNMRVAHRELWLDGEIAVPVAKLQPKEFTSAVSVSPDVVIAGTPESTLPPWRIHNRVRLLLGDRVSLYGFGFEGNINGNLLLIDEPGKPTAATGELNVVEGRYRAYGQRLEVEQGRLLFAGGPITNPALDLRAVRHIQEVTAGIKVYGPLRQPEFELFSTPAMDQTEALSYLVLGMPLEQTQSQNDGAAMAQAALALGVKGGDFLARSIGDRFGIDEMRVESSDQGDQAALVMGRYLSPRLYVGYGVGLVDAVNTFNLRYQLSTRWQLKAESGLSQGADMIYTIEK